MTRCYFECDPPGDGKRKFGYSRDKRSDCVQVVIALIVTPDGFPVAGLVGIEGGVVSGVTNLESPGVDAGQETTP